MWTTAQRAKFFQDVPPLMVHHPHIFMLQQREAMRNEMMKKQSAGISRADAEAVADATIEGGVKSASAGGRLDANALRASGMLTFLTTPEGRGKLGALAEKVKRSKERLAPMVSAWDKEKKREVFEGFGDNDVMKMMAEMGDDPGQKMLLLMDLQQEQLDQLMTLMLVLSFEDSAELLHQMRETIVNDHLGNDPSGKGAMLNHIISTLGSLSKFGAKPAAGGGPAAAAASAAPLTAAPQCSHDHSHEHGHGHSHSHTHQQQQQQHPGMQNPAMSPAVLTSNTAPRTGDYYRDVSSGKGQSMDR